MRILMTSYEFPPIGGGGAAVVAGLSRELVAKGHDVDLVTMRFQGNPTHENVNGVQVHRVPCWRRVKHVCTAPEAFSYVAAAGPVIRELLASKRFDIVHSHFILPDGLLAWRIRQTTGLPYVVTAHGTDVPGFNPHRMRLAHRLLRPVWHKVVQGASRIVSPSGVLEQLVHAQRNDPGKTLVIPNGLEVGEYTPHGTDPKVLVVTRMLERKGVQFLLESLAQAPIDHEVNIVGEGPYLPELRRQAAETGVRVKFWGWLENRSPQLRELYESSTIFVFPSEAENFPIVLLEAMAARLAIITSAGTGCAEVVGDAALLVPPKDPEAITRALRRLIDEPDLRRSLGAAARRRIEENFTWSAVAGRYLEEYARHTARATDWAGNLPASGGAPLSRDSVLSD